MRSWLGLASDSVIHDFADPGGEARHEYLESNAYVKGEGDDLINIGLGHGTAVDTFSDRLIGAVPVR